MPFVAATVAGSPDNTSVTTSPINTTGANLIVLSLASGGGDVAFFSTDSAGNNWSSSSSTAVNITNSNGFFSLLMVYIISPTTSATHTFTYSKSSSFPTLSAFAWNSSSTPVFDQVNSAINSSQVTSLQPGSVTPSQNNELIITSLGENSGDVATTTIDSGFNIAAQVSATGTAHAVATAYLKQSTLGAVNPTWQWTSAQYPAAGIVTFQAAAEGSRSGLLLLGNSIGWMPSLSAVALWRAGKAVRDNPILTRRRLLFKRRTMYNP